MCIQIYQYQAANIGTQPLLSARHPSIPFIETLRHEDDETYLGRQRVRNVRRRNDNSVPPTYLMCRVPPNDLRELFIRVPRSIRTATTARPVTASRTDGRLYFRQPLYTTMSRNPNRARNPQVSRIRAAHRTGIIPSFSAEKCV